jgi:hypothetical protein
MFCSSLPNWKHHFRFHSVFAVSSLFLVVCVTSAWRAILHQLLANSEQTVSHVPVRRQGSSNSVTEGCGAASFNYGVQCVWLPNIVVRWRVCEGRFQMAMPTNHDLLLRRVTFPSYTFLLSLRSSTIVSSRVLCDYCLFVKWLKIYNRWLPPIRSVCWRCLTCLEQRTGVLRRCSQQTIFRVFVQWHRRRYIPSDWAQFCREVMLESCKYQFWDMYLQNPLH